MQQWTIKFHFNSDDTTDAESVKDIAEMMLDAVDPLNGYFSAVSVEPRPATPPEVFDLKTK